MELSRQKVGEVENKFSKTFNISPGTYQYKFRLGYGDWWICDEDSNIGIVLDILCWDSTEIGNSNG